MIMDQSWPWGSQIAFKKKNTRESADGTFKIYVQQTFTADAKEMLFHDFVNKFLKKIFQKAFFGKLTKMFCHA